MIKLTKDQLGSNTKPLTSQSSKLKPLKPSSKQHQSTSSNGRLNEPVLTTRRTSRYSRGGTRSSQQLASSNKKYIVDQADREAWMLQVLCQILQTDNLTDVQSWLVSTRCDATSAMSRVCVCVCVSVI